jgi:uncharacterized membrane protein YebE (DUF533 family)
MFDATRLLGALLQNRAAPSAGNRLENAIRSIGGQGQGQGGLGGLLGGLLGGGAAGGGLGGLLGGGGGGAQGRPAGAGGGGGDLGGMLGQIAEMARQAMNNPGQELRQNNPLAVGGLGALAGAILGGRGRGAVAGSLLAVLGSLAVRAMQGQGGAAAAQGGAGGDAVAATLPQTEEELQHEARLVLRAVVQAAQADGRVDPSEIGRIVSRLEEGGEDAEARAFVESEMLKAPDVEALAREVRSPEQAARVYAASLLAVEVDTEAERDHLRRLAAALRLPPEAVSRIHQSLGVVA